MKRVLGLCLAVGVFTLGISARAEAVPSVSIRICQGSVCAELGPGVLLLTAPMVVVGDYLVSVSASSQEGPVLSNSQMTSIQVQRVGLNSPAVQLEVWVSVTGYVLPVAPALVFSSTFGATSSPGGDQVNPTYQAWYSPSNSSIIGGSPTAPPADGNTAGPIGCFITGGDNLRRPGATACSAFPVSSVNIAPAVPFSLVTRTTLNIPTTSVTTYGWTGQATVRVVP